MRGRKRKREFKRDEGGGGGTEREGRAKLNSGRMTQNLFCTAVQLRFITKTNAQKKKTRKYQNFNFTFYYYWH